MYFYIIIINCYESLVRQSQARNNMKWDPRQEKIRIGSFTFPLYSVVGSHLLHRIIIRNEMKWNDYFAFSTSSIHSPKNTASTTEHKTRSHSISNEITTHPWKHNQANRIYFMSWDIIKERRVNIIHHQYQHFPYKLALLYYPSPTANNNNSLDSYS